MKLAQFNPIFLILFTFLVVSCAKEDNDSIYVEQVNNVQLEYSSLELEILDLVNAYRESIGVPNLLKMDIVSSVALTHTNYMIEVGQINHDFFAERQAMLVKNANAKTVGENVAYGYNSAQAVVNAWLKSDSHKKLIENPNYTHFGISTKSNCDGRNFFTQMFIERN